MRVLIVEDDVAVRQLVTRSLAKQGVEITTAGTCAAGLAELHHSSFDVAILDLTLPDGSGLDLVRTLRELGSPAHVIMLSAAGSERDRVQALELGADDYVVKPFFVRELVARILAVRRRRDGARDTTLEYGAIVIDLAARQVTIDGAATSLTTKEFDLLAFLAARPGYAFSRDELLRSVWQSASDWQQPSTVTEHVRRIRTKIEPDPLNPLVLQTVRGVGYRFEPPHDKQVEQAVATSPGHVVSGVEGTMVLVDGHIVAADPSIVSMIGVATEADLLGRDVLELVAPQSMTAAQARRDAASTGLAQGSQVVAMRRPDGTESFVEVTSSSAEWNGGPARRLSIHPSADPPARLRQLVTGVFSEVSDAVIVTDPHLHVRSWNQAAARLYGWAEHEVLGRHLFDVVKLAADDPKLTSGLLTLEETGRWFGESHQVARDGSLVTVSSSMTLVRDDPGEPVVIVSVNRPAAVPRSNASPHSRNSQVETEIQRGLDRDEFVVHYQPVVALDDLHVITVEALVRWNHPDRGLLLPASFIDAAERTGLIVELGRAVFHDACRQTAEWRRAGIDLGVAINLSARQLSDVALFDDISAMLTVTGLDPDALWLEVTETALVEDVSQAADVLHRLAATGIGITIDDFGTGWASLTYLKQFPVSALKIDRSFVTDIDLNPQDAAIARSILSLGEELDLVVVAEGIETVPQQQALQALGCMIGQGFLFGKPVPAAEVPIERARRFRRADGLGDRMPG
ncbi:MAG: diguanylate cyclase [Acidimicrobiaceae bacterium]